MPSGHSVRGRTLAALAGLFGLACLAVPGVASAGSSTAPGMPTHIKVAHVSRSSFTVTTSPAPNTQRYRVFAATRGPDLAVAGMAHDVHSAASHSPSITLRGLRFRTAPYFYRVETINGSHHRFSPVASVGLLPATPTNVVATSNTSGTYLTWSSDPATGFNVEQATDPAMTQNLHTYAIVGADRQFTPVGLVNGTEYYFRVQAVNAGTVSTFSPIVQAQAMSYEQPVSVMTYNILEASLDGQKEGSGRVAPWSKRAPAAVRLIKQGNPDVIGIQEGASFIAKHSPVRQVDDLVRMFHGTYKLAVTETPPTLPHYRRTADYILYKPNVYQPVGQGGHWAIGDSHWAAYQVLQNQVSGAKFLFVSTHLVYPRGAASDRAREAETKSILSQAGSYAYAVGGLPIVYVGDFNSEKNVRTHPIDGPGIAMHAADVDDAYAVSQVRTDATFNSANQYLRRPVASSARIDYVFAPPGIGVQSWRMVVDLRHGRFVGTIPSDHNPIVSTVVIPFSPVVAS